MNAISNRGDRRQCDRGPSSGAPSVSMSSLAVFIGQKEGAARTYAPSGTDSASRNSRSSRAPSAARGFAKRARAR